MASFWVIFMLLFENGHPAHRREAESLEQWDGVAERRWH